jgi:hypothetical protein
MQSYFRYCVILVKLLLILFLVLLSFTIVFGGTITVESLPSGKNTGMPYKWSLNTWNNFCPLCGKYDCLLINPKGVYENELTCKYCDADYCGSSGIDKSSKPRTRLTKTKFYKNEIDGWLNTNNSINSRKKYYLIFF